MITADHYKRLSSQIKTKTGTKEKFFLIIIDHRLSMIIFTVMINQKQKSNIKIPKIKINKVLHDVHDHYQRNIYRGD